MNLVVGWDLLACSIKRSTSFLSLFQREKISSIHRLHSFGLVSLFCISFVSISALKTLAHDAVTLEIVLSIELEGALFEEETKHFF